MNAFERRQQIIDRMTVRKFDTAFNLAGEFGVSKCTVFRDVQELSVCGYPIQADTGRGGGIRWVGGKKQYPFSERELLALKNAIAAVSAEDKLVLENLLRDNGKPDISFNSNDIFKLLEDGKSQAELARELGISKGYLTRLLTGERLPGAELAGRISKYITGLAPKEETNNENRSA